MLNFKETKNVLSNYYHIKITVLNFKEPSQKRTFSVVLKNIFTAVGTGGFKIKCFIFFAYVEEFW